MVKGHLYDLDELVLKCHGPSARDYIEEAVISYKAGAYRSAIISTWLAVYFDLVDKLRALAAAKVESAQGWIKDYDKLARKYDPTKADKTLQDLQAKERTILDMCAGEAIGIIRKVEQPELERIREDRNKCAHPTVVDVSEVFVPSAELARTHIRSAIEYVLSRGAIPGRLMADRLLAFCKSPYFPDQTEQALEEISERFGSSIDETVVSLVLPNQLEELFDTGNSVQERFKIVSTIDAIGLLQPSAAAKSLDTAFSDLAEEEDQKVWAIVVGSLHRISWAWNALSGANKSLVGRVVGHADSSTRDGRAIILQATYLPGIPDALRPKLLQIPFRQVWSQRNIIGLDLYTDTLVTLLGDADSFDNANHLLRYIAKSPELFADTESIRQILVAAEDNHEVYKALELPEILQQIVSEDSIDHGAITAEFNRLLDKVPGWYGSVISEKRDIAEAFRIRIEEGQETE